MYTITAGNGNYTGNILYYAVILSAAWYAGSLGANVAIQNSAMDFSDIH